MGLVVVKRMGLVS